MNNELEKSLADIAKALPEKIVVSGGRAKYRRVNISRVKDSYLAEELTKTQAFHEKVETDGLAAFLRGLFEMGHSQIHAYSKSGTEHALRVTKKGKVLEARREKLESPTTRSTHNREKNYFIPETANLPVLRDMGVVTAAGKVASDMHGKFRQINRFLEIVDDVFKQPPDPIKIVDFGCGKSYLTFLVYHYFTVIKGVSAEITGLDLKRDVIENCRKLAMKYGYPGLNFELGDIANYADFQADLLITLHACDTATDHALYNAVKNNVRVILAAPCCQHELNDRLAPLSMSIFSRYGLLKERVAAILTDAVRANLLTYLGYKTQILEFIGFDHTPKNLLIRAVKSNIPNEKRRAAFDEVMAAVKEFKVEPTLLHLVTSL